MQMETICMTCQNLFSGENISICRLLKISPIMLSVKHSNWYNDYYEQISFELRFVHMSLTVAEIPTAPQYRVLP